MSGGETATAPLELWGGIECTVNRVHGRWADQSRRTGHDARVDDLDRFAELGIKTLRYPALWERIAPVSLDAPDWRWTDQRLGKLRALGIRPILGLLHHGSGPAYTSLVDPHFPRQLSRFARMVATRYPWVEDYTPINEPLTTARFSALYGHWYPHDRSASAFVRALLNQLRGVAEAMGAIRAVTPAARLVQTEDCGAVFGTHAVRHQVEHEQQRRWLTWDLLMGQVGPEHPLYAFLRGAGATRAELAWLIEHPVPPDLIGLNYYLTSDRLLDDRLEQYPTWAHGQNDSMRYADIEAVRARAEGIVGHEAHLLETWRRYRRPMAITEAHLGCSREEQARWLAESWRGALKARERGADVRAVTAWALLGSYDWDSLMTRDTGRYEPGVYDVRAPHPRPTMLASMVRDLAAGRSPAHPVLDGRGWWRRSTRLLYGGVSRQPERPAPTPARPILIVGATGSLGRELERVCRARGLAHRLAARPEVDITDADSIDAVLRDAQPWAVLNAAGYARIDDAEHEPDACRRLNAFGAAQVVTACRSRGISLLAFSSDMIFDGTAQRPYTESDRSRPLNVYGATQVEAERLVLSTLPHALIVRTGPCFGTASQQDYLAGVLRSIGRGDAVQVVADTVVSPTYVPDLLNAALDLLIDGEAGVWHLANEGAVSWYELAHQAAALLQLPTDSMVPAPAAAVWSPAVRPRFSALTSVRGDVMRPLGEALAAYLTSVGHDTWTQQDRVCASR
jgi:dTDP-4-dehydrorhamnose reductase